MSLADYKVECEQKWEAVRPVVIFFAGERFVVDYEEHFDPVASPVVAMVHAYLDNMNLTKNDN